MKQKNTGPHDIDSLNQNILSIDLDDLEVEAMEQRIEMTLATLFGADFWGDPGECGTFACSQFIPDV